MYALVAEVQPTNAKYLETLLKYYGKVDPAVDGESAWELYLKSAERGERYDIAFIDYALPIVDGTQVQQLIRAWETKNQIAAADRTKLVLTTGHYSNHIVLDGFSKGSDLFLPKPFSIAQVQGFLKETGIKLPIATRY